ncbi:hypothetical protein [Piscinibacter sp. HJYY11]|uniref:hypothetical protein n=1 Tax=Piscinibacter sp. HJYY11 TaxID=2801333 RepID=UPI00191E6547|nr:hypothetical protein [Piscinibacter sp. HJYY11]MBL0726893.1 hypothetical protein [Piscinibacter sp. HJYY11]
MPLPARFTRPSAILLALSLAACGGAGGDDAASSGGGGGGGGGGGAATVASVNKFSFPAGSPDIASMQATNDGVYLRMYDTGGNDIIVKRTARGSTTGRWMQWQLPVVAASFSASLSTTEGIDEFGIHWSGIAQGTGTRRYGTANMNNGGISLNYLDDRNIELIVPDGDSSTSALSWGLSGNYVYRESRSGTASTSFSARYERIATLSSSGLGTWPAVADGTGNLYAASGSNLFRIGATGDARRWDFSTLGYGSIHTLIYKHNRLWIGYRDLVMTLPLGSNTVSSFATLNHSFATTALQPQFCISGGTLYGSDGMAYDGLPSINTPRPWLQGPGSVSPATQLAVTEISSAVQSGMFCAGSSTPTIYAAGLDLSANGTMKLFAISPR